MFDFQFPLAKLGFNYCEKYKLLSLDAVCCFTFLETGGTEGE